jgi:hypothetical protein
MTENTQKTEKITKLEVEELIKNLQSLIVKVNFYFLQEKRKKNLFTKLK